MSNGIIVIIMNGINSLYVLKKIIVPIPANINKIPPILGFDHAKNRQIIKMIVGIRCIKKPNENNFVSNAKRVINMMYKIERIFAKILKILFFIYFYMF